VSSYAIRALVVLIFLFLEKSRVVFQLRSSSSTQCGKSSPPFISGLMIAIEVVTDAIEHQ
jgi:hypothetical protein